MTDTLQVLQILATLTVLITFILTRRKEAMAAGARQKELDIFMDTITKAVEKLTQAIKDQEKNLQELRMWLELLLQQHFTNHGQDIRR